MQGIDPPVSGPQRVPLRTSARITIGRDPSNDVVLDDPNVSRFHAEVRRRARPGSSSRDLGSPNGHPRRTASSSRGALDAGADVRIGPFRLVFDGTAFVARDERGALRLTPRRRDAVKDKQILEPTT